MAIFQPIPGFKGRTFVGSGFSKKGTSIFVSAVPHCNCESERDAIRGKPPPPSSSLKHKELKEETVLYTGDSLLVLSIFIFYMATGNTFTIPSLITIVLSNSSSGLVTVVAAFLFLLNALQQCCIRLTSLQT